MTGRAIEIADPNTIAVVTEAYQNLVQEHETLFAFDIERCLHAKYRRRGDWPPVYTKWADPAES